MGKATVHTEAMRRGATAMGGEATLARALQVSPEQVHDWVAGDEYPPTDMYLRVLDLLIATGAH